LVEEPGSGPWGPDFASRKRWFDAFPLHRQFGLTLEEQRAGFARCLLTTSPFTLGGVGGSVHGGILAAIVDCAMLAALGGMFGDGEQPSGTADLNITYMRPALGERVYAEAVVIKKGRSLAVIEVTITDAEGRLCAKGRTLYAIKSKA
jgi:uncharacterized protein (TIGR00369 family)